MTEAELMGAVIEAARLLGWRVAHFRPCRTRHGWVTAVQADGAGFPDLLLVRDRLVAAELKVQGRRLTDDQQRWLDALRVAGAEVHVWREQNWLDGTIDRALA